MDSLGQQQRRRGRPPSRSKDSNLWLEHAAAIESRESERTNPNRDLVVQYMPQPREHPDHSTSNLLLPLGVCQLLAYDRLHTEIGH